MTRPVICALALLLAVAPAPEVFAQTAPPAGQTPQPGISGTSPTPSSASGATTQTGTTNTNPATGSTAGQVPGGAASTRAAPRRGARGRAAQPASTADVANSKVVISGSDSPVAKPSDDHPMLLMAPVAGNSLGIRSGTPIHVQLQQRVDSGHVHNGDTLKAKLIAPIAGLVQGTPVQLTVVQASQAGALTSAGELSVQVTRIGNYDVLSVIVTALGKEGKTEVSDAAPATGTEAEFPAGQDISFPAA